MALPFFWFAWVLWGALAVLGYWQGLQVPRLRGVFFPLGVTVAGLGYASVHLMAWAPGQRPFLIPAVGFLVWGLAGEFGARDLLRSAPQLLVAERARSRVQRSVALSEEGGGTARGPQISFLVWAALTALVLGATLAGEFLFGWEISPATRALGSAALAGICCVAGQWRRAAERRERDRPD